MQNDGMDEAQAGIKIAGRNINNLRYAVEKAMATHLVGYNPRDHKELDMTDFHFASLHFALK